MQYMILQEQVQQLVNIYNTLNDISTKGLDSEKLVDSKRLLKNILENLLYKEEDIKEE